MRRGAGWSPSLCLRVETCYPLLPRAARVNKGLRLKETRLTSGIHNFWLLHYYSKIIKTLNFFLRELSSFLNAANLMRLFTKKKKDTYHRLDLTTGLLVHPSSVSHTEAGQSLQRSPSPVGPRIIPHEHQPPSPGLLIENKCFSHLVLSPTPKQGTTNCKLPHPSC